MHNDKYGQRLTCQLPPSKPTANTAAAADLSLTPLPMPPTPPHRLLPDNDKRRGATTLPIATAIVNVTAPTSTLHQPPPPRRRSCPSHGLSNARIGRGRNLMSSQPRGQRQQRWLQQWQCIGEGKRPGKGEGGQWTLMHTTFGLAESREGGEEVNDDIDVQPYFGDAWKGVAWATPLQTQAG